MPSSDASRHAPVSMDGNPTIDERANHCFGCGPANPQGLHLTFSTETSAEGSPITTAQLQLDRLHEGPPGYVHGGIIATLLDEAMSKLNRPLDVLAVTRHMEIDYLRPVPLFQPLTLIGRHSHREGRKLFHHAEILDAKGIALARSKGIFIQLDKALLARGGFSQPED
ncbi:MAG TPA: PaaI family thioesterase [Edaphobacter sp.]|nr:PaaI family thioesterase [Edaphobacter sp.]